MKVTIGDVEKTVVLVERLAGSQLARWLLDLARERFGSQWDAADIASMDANFADGVARRADAAARANDAGES